MKFLKWIIIGIGALTGGIFLPGVLHDNVSETFVPALVALTFCAIAYSIGYVTIYLLELRKLRNTHQAILLPWLSFICVCGFLALINLNVFFGDIIEGSLELVFASLGGVIAHHGTLKKLAI